MAVEDIKTKESKDTYIYLIQMGYWVKIGFTNDIKKRMHSMERTFLPYKLSLIAKKKCNDMPRTFENMLHTEHQNHRKHGEWFLLGQNIVYELVKKHSFELCNDYIIYEVEKEFKIYGDLLDDRKKYSMSFNESDIINIDITDNDDKKVSERCMSASTTLTKKGEIFIGMGLLYIPTLIVIAILMIYSNINGW